MSSSRQFVVSHKWWSAIIALVVLFVGWQLYGNLTSTAGETRYILSTVQTGTIVSSVTASGQVAANQLLDITPKVSGQITYVGVQPGQVVKTGTLIAEIDTTDAQKTVRDAQANLQSAKLSLQKLQEPADQLTLTQANNALTQAQTGLATAYQSSVNDIADAFLDLPTIMTGMQNIDFGTDASGNVSQQNIDYYGNTATLYNPLGSSYRDAAYNAYQTARTSYDATFADYKTMPSSPDAATTERLLTETYNTSVLTANALKTTYSLIQFYSDQLTQNNKTLRPVATTHINALNSYIGKINPHTSSLLSDTNSLSSDKTDIIEKQQSLAKVQAGADTLDLQSAQLSVTQRQNALLDAQNTLADYYIRAPFDGTIAAVNVHTYDNAGGSAIATLITSQQLADMSLNEVDAAKILLGDKVTLTFDAIPDLTLTGKVAQINPVGTVSQGVVNYDVKIQFDSQDPRVKSGMTVNAAIITASHMDVLTVPQSAVKTQNGNSFVQMFDTPITATAITAAGSQGVLSATAPKQVPVQVGISDDTNVEITSGLTNGEQIITRTITGTATTAAAPSSSSSFGGASRGGGAGAAGIRL